MSPDLRFVFGGEELVDEAEALWLALFDHHLAVGNGGLPGIDRSESWPLRRQFYAGLFADPRTFVLLAYRGQVAVGYVVGHVFAGPDDTWPTGDLIGEIETLSVLPAERGAGLGTALLDRAEARLTELGAECIFIKTISSNDGAHRFYQARGMTPVITTFIRLPPQR